jgi:hypothetical protein
MTRRRTLDATALGRWRGVAWATALGACALACSDPGPPSLEQCPSRVSEAALDVSGVYRYSSPIFGLRGSITFAQQDGRVRVLNTTYDNADDRSLVGEARLEGNHAALTLVPENGDADYSAEVEFIFGTGVFCVRRFSDTNDDVGGDGSYRGARVEGAADASTGDAS